MAPKSMRPSVVLVKNGKILLLKSKYSSGEFYLLPGGSIENMETTTETAVRETKEETGYNIKIRKLLYLQEWVDKERDKNVLYVIFLGEIIGGEETHLNDPCLEKGHIQKIEWINIKDLHKIQFYPEEIVPFLGNDFKNKFKNGAIYI